RRHIMCKLIRRESGFQKLPLPLAASCGGVTLRKQGHLHGTGERGELREQRQRTAVWRLAGIAAHEQTVGRRGMQSFKQGASLFARVDDIQVVYRGWKRARRPGDVGG